VSCRFHNWGMQFKLVDPFTMRSCQRSQLDDMTINCNGEEIRNITYNISVLNLITIIF
jgi:hypothetical protein